MAEGYIMSFDGGFEWLSNDTPCDLPQMSLNIAVDRPQVSAEVRSVTHAYEAAKARDAKEAANVLGSRTALIARRLGNLVTPHPSWNLIRLAVMDRWLRHKFSEWNPALVTYLRRTGDRKIMAPDLGGFWGWSPAVGSKQQGWNHLGILIMKIRDELPRLGPPRAGPKFKLEDDDDMSRGEEWKKPR